MNKSIGIGCLAVVLVLVAVLGMGGCTSYNGLVAEQQNVEKAWAQVETVYQRRLDLIPNLVATVEAQAGFEKSTLSEIASARASINQIRLAPGQAPDEVTMKQFESAQGSLGSALGRLLAVSENYPQLRANEAFMGLQAELAGTENRISVERGRFNEAAQAYNTKIRSIPAVFYAGALGFQSKAYFTSSPAAAEPPKVQFNLGNKPSAPTPAPAAPAPAAPAPLPAITPAPALVK
jgi:LemA protein